MVKKDLFGEASRYVLPVVWASLALIFLAFFVLAVSDGIKVRAPTSGTNYSAGNYTGNIPTLFNVSFVNGTIGTVVVDTNGSTALFNATFWINISATQWVEVGNSTQCLTHEAGGFSNNMSCWAVLNASSLYNGSIVSDGYYTINATVWNGTARLFINATNMTTIMIDNKGPSLVSVVDANLNRSYLNFSTISLSGANATINFTVSDALANVSTVIFNLINSSGNVNATIIGIAENSAGRYSAKINITHFPQGKYNITVFANDSVGNFNATANDSFAEVTSVGFDNTVPAVAIITPTSGTNHSRFTAAADGLMLINVTITDSLSGPSYLLANLSNATIAVPDFTTVLTRQGSSNNYNGSINSTSFAEGLYNLTIFANDSVGNTNSTTSSLRIRFDRIVPAVLAANLTTDGSPASYGNYSDAKGLLVLNVSFYDLNSSISAALFNITNSTGNQNATYIGVREDGRSVSVTLNTTHFPDGLYNVTIVYVNDSAGNQNSSASISVVRLRLDNTVPSVSVSCSPSSVTSGNTITCTCSPSDALSGINTSTTSYTANPSTSNTGTFTSTCTTIDYANNPGTGSTTYTVEQSGSGSSSSSGSGSAATQTWTTYKVDTAKFQAGHTRRLKANQRLEVQIENQNHTIGIKSVSSRSVTIVVASTPQEVTLAEGGTQKFEVTGDNYYDASVNIKDISGIWADIIILSIHEAIPQAAAGGEDTSGTGGEDLGASPEQASSNKWIIYTLVIVVVLAVVATAWL